MHIHLLIDERNRASIFEQRTPNETIIKDIYDGKVYQEKLKKFGSPAITLIFNTDGAQVVKSRKKTLWPIFLAVNELPAETRFEAIESN
jgi:hypothetical protein